jgi:hypothetical protein
MQIGVFNIDSFFKFYLTSFLFIKKYFKMFVLNNKGRPSQFASVGTTDEIIWVLLEPVFSDSQPAQLKTKTVWTAITGASVLIRISNLLVQEEITVRINWWLLCLKLRSLKATWRDKMWYVLHFLYQECWYLNNMGFTDSVNIL